MILAAYTYHRPVAAGGGVVFHLYAAVAIGLCLACLWRSYRELSAPRRAARAAAREECDRYGHEWGEEQDNPMFAHELIRNCKRCKAQEHTRHGQWPAARR